MFKLQPGSQLWGQDGVRQILFFFKKLEVFKTHTCGKEHLPSKNHEITELDKSMSMCGMEW